MMSAEFSTAHSTKTSLLHHILHLDPLPDHPKSSKIIQWMYQDQLWWLGMGSNGFDIQSVGRMDNGLVVKSCHSSYFNSPQHKNQPVASHPALESPSRPSKIIQLTVSDQLWWLGIGSNGLDLLSVGCMDICLK
jgi:hypothetical protein